MASGAFVTTEFNISKARDLGVGSADGVEISSAEGGGSCNKAGSSSLTSFGCSLTKSRGVGDGEFVAKEKEDVSVGVEGPVLNSDKEVEFLHPFVLEF